MALAPASEAVLAQQSAPAPVAKTAVTASTPATATPTGNIPARKPTTATNKTASKRHKRDKAASKEVEKSAEPVVQAPPPPPPTPEESPAAAPQVTYQNGQLSIRSENSTLGSILSAVKARTGASLDGPGASSSERVATQLGPGDPRDVLTTLLSSTKYDYMLVGAPDNPSSVQKIILTARASSGPATASGATTAATRQRPVQNFQTPAEQPDADQSLPDAEIPDDSANQVGEEPPQPEQPEVQPEPQPEQPQPGPNGFPGQPPNGEADQQNGNQPKSPEQLLQELQRMQQQQQQQQQQHPDEPR